MYHIRPVEDRDYEAIAAIRSCVAPEPVYADDIREQDQRAMHAENSTFHRFVATDAEERVVGYAFVEHMQWDPEGLWSLNATVHPNCRGQGLGTKLLNHVEPMAVQAGATALEAWVRGEDDASFAWAQRRGYALERQRTESILDLEGWDPSRWEECLARAQAGGLRLVTLDQVTDEAVWRAMYECDRITSPDVPVWTEGTVFPPYETWMGEWEKDSAPKCFALAFDGDRVVGMSILWLPRRAGGAAYTGYTATLREYRGRGIALALKVLTINVAKAAGCPRTRTNNDPDNPPMLAVNARLGYTLVPGPRRLRRPLS